MLCGGEEAMIDRLTHPKLLSLLAYWQGKHDGDHLPSRRSIDPLEMSEWLGNLILIDVTPDGDYRYRLYGSEFVAEFGREMTGHSIRELPKEQQALIEAEYEFANRTRKPAVRVYTADFDAGNMFGSQDASTKRATWERLILPLASDGVTVDMLLVGAYELER
jgi:hypothetical protein